MKNLRVLIVDTVKDDGEHTASFLRQQGHTVMFAENGEEGVQMAERELPDLILMDVVMPVVNGFQATRQLSKSEVASRIPVIVISCKDEETDKLWAMQQGAKAYLTKQVDKASLFDAIETVMA